MGYNVELSFNILKQSSISNFIELVVNIAENNGCKNYYYDGEFNNDIYQQRNHYVLNFDFQNEKFENFLNFIKNVKKIKNLNIEIIYENDNIILYASSFYISKMMDKQIAKNYRKNKRERSYSEDDILVLNEVERKSG
jgi:hypothetical protein